MRRKLNLQEIDDVPDCEKNCLVWITVLWLTDRGCLQNRVYPAPQAIWDVLED
jgi:hypothetical protein